MKPKYDTFADFLAAHARGEVDRDRLNLICWSGSCAVTIEQDGQARAFPDRNDETDESTVLFKSETAEQFAFDVIEALGGEGRMA
jgi:hypothetical protein